MHHSPGGYGGMLTQKIEKNEAAKTCRKNFHCWKVFKASTKVTRG